MGSRLRSFHGYSNADGSRAVTRLLGDSQSRIVARLIECPDSRYGNYGPPDCQSERLIRANPFQPWALRLAGSSFPQLKHSEGGRNREECWQNCEENCDIGEKNGAMDGQWLIR